MIEVVSELLRLGRATLGLSVAVRRYNGAGVDSEKYCPDRLAAKRFLRQYGITGPFLLAVDPFSAEKEYAFLFRSLETLGWAAPRLVICGEGGDEFRLRNIAADHHVSVTILGRIPPADMIGAYNACLALVHPGDAETLRLAVLEAMSCARPVIAVAGGALAEVLGDDDACGLLVPPNSEHAMAAAIDKVMRDTTVGAAMGRRGRARAEAHFSLDSMERSYVGLVRRHLRTDRGAIA